MWRVLFVLVLAVGLWAGCMDRSEPTPDFEATPTPVSSNKTPSPTSSRPGTFFSVLPANHISEGTAFQRYNSIPPTSGPHWASVAEWGIHAEPVPNGRQVHNLEHGGVLIQYNAEDTELVAKLEEFAKKQPGYPCYLIVAPYPDLPFTIALTAWGVRDVMDLYDEASLQAFVDAFRNRGPEQVPCRPDPT